MVQNNEDAATGTYVQIYGNSTTPADNDVVAGIALRGNDDAAGSNDLAQVDAQSLDVSAGTEDARLRLRTLTGGTLATKVYVGDGLYTAGQTDMGINTINATAVYQGGVAIPIATASAQTGTTHAPAAGDNGNTFIYNNASGCTVTLPDSATLTAGWKIHVINASVGTITFNRSASDVIYSKASSLTSIKLPSANDGGYLIYVGSAVFHWQGRRSFTSANQDISPAATYTVAHTLGVVPDDITVWLKNVSAQGSYNGEETLIHGGPAEAAALDRGVATWMDATNIHGKCGSDANVFSYLEATTGVQAFITNASWKVIYRCYVIN